MKFEKEALSALYGLTIEDNIKYISSEHFETNNQSGFLNFSLPKFTNMFSNVKDYISNAFSTTPEELKEYTKEQQKILQGLKDKTFIELSEYLVPIPENFTGNYIDYLQTLEPIVKESFVSCIQNINDFKNYLGLFLSTSDYKTSFKDFSSKYKQLETYRTRCSKILGRFFPKDTASSRTMLKNVVERIADFETIYGITNRLNSIIQSVNVSNIRSLVDDCYNTLSIITTNLGAEDSKVSKEAAKNLSVGTFEIAKYVEFISVLYFDTVTAIKSAINMGDILINSD